MYQFAIINQPDADSGYTLDDNARALVAICQHFELSKDDMDIESVADSADRFIEPDFGQIHLLK